MITTVTMNASIDKAYYISQAIENGTVMRVKTCFNSAGGKGLNVARIVKLCGGLVQATGLVGGFNGQYLESLLDKDLIPHNFLHIQGETRSCINILDEKYGSTEYLEPGCEVTAEEELAFMEKFPEIIQDSNVVTISGSIPKGMKTDIYGRLISIAKSMGKQVILDSSGETLREGIPCLPTIVKPNQDEIQQFFQVSIHNIEEEIIYAQKIYDLGIPYVVISLGEDGALMICKDGVFQGKPPKVQVINTVGCGDSMVGALAVSMELEHSPQEALKHAVAVATANALSPHTGHFDKKHYQRLMKEVQVEPLSVSGYSGHLSR